MAIAEISHRGGINEARLRPRPSHCSNGNAARLLVAVRQSLLDLPGVTHVRYLHVRIDRACALREIPEASYFSSEELHRGKIAILVSLEQAV